MRTNDRRFDRVFAVHLSNKITSLDMLEIDRRGKMSHLDVAIASLGIRPHRTSHLIGAL